MQCDDSTGVCWCVDEYGMELAGTRGTTDRGNTSTTACLKLRHDTETDCPGLLCRLGCDYGFAIDKATGCPLCECRNPCDPDSGLVCPAGQECQLVATQCNEAPFCPALPFCTAVSRSRVDEDDEDQVEDGQEETAKLIKAGQCPYLVPVSVDSCDSECSADEDCDGQLKCCSNGCGTQCVEPLVKTACQHAQMVMKYRARESGQPANRLFIPRCRQEDGAYEPVQCDPISRACWCVSTDGRELAGTRVPPGLTPQCHQPRLCPAFDCALDCAQHGFQLDTSGCPVCACRDPCQGVQCRPGVEECRLVQVNCITAPCPPLAVCLPRLDNPCAHGSPLTTVDSASGANRTVSCGPMGEGCPSTHKCHLSPLGEFSVCCPKPRDVCFQERSVGGCKSSLLRWSFNEKRNKCEAFRFTGCSGNANNFDSERDCKAVCPVLSSCEELREKNLKMADKFKKVTFTPKCNRSTGDWEPIQCLEVRNFKIPEFRRNYFRFRNSGGIFFNSGIPAEYFFLFFIFFYPQEVGICWCVDKDGDHIKGSLTRGTPICGVRQARQRSMDQPICDDPAATVHLCDPKAVCAHKICLADPKAVCRVNPCGGCHAAFYDASGRQVDCQAGLTKCQLEVQAVLNSDTWARQGGPWGANSAQHVGVAFKYDLDGYAGPESEAEGLPEGTPLTVAIRLKRTLPDEFYPAGLLGPSEILALMTEEGTDLPSLPVTQETDTAADEEEDTTEAAADGRSSKRLDGLASGQQLPSNGFPSADQDEDGPEDAVEVVARPGIPALRDAIKPGFCPPVRSRTFLRVLAQFAGGSACADQCVSDADCAGPHRCCPGECGSSCTPPVLLPTPLLPKPGACPAPAYPFGCPAELAGDSANECAMDADCPSRTKCCSDGCSSTCTLPEEGSSGPLLMSISPPVCTLKGDYAREQSQGELSWCVDGQGRPIDESFTRGSVRCSPNGTVLEQRALGAICPHDPSAVPSVCKDECLTARCPFHPEAVCVADPCNGCAVSFIHPETGKALECSDRCSQPAETGHCRALFPRYFFNATSGKCAEFVYGGCEGNSNNFESLDECRGECEAPAKAVSVCDLPADAGLCRASLVRWHYNSASQQCEEFDYGGCGGNANNFHSFQQCANRCPDLVLCPHGSPAASGEVKSCSRDEACGQRPAGCHGHPDASCSVDPCTCSAIYLDAQGRAVECLDAPLEEEAEPRHAASLPEATTTTTTEASTTTVRGVKALMGGPPHPTRCQKMRQASLKSAGTAEFVPECDFAGRFQPIQCASKSSCWCVDEAGVPTNSSVRFQRGEQTCRLVPVMAVAVTLGFPAMVHGDDAAHHQAAKEEMEREAAQQVAEILNGLSARTMEPELVVLAHPQDGTILSFTLVGDNKIDVASHLEDMVKAGHLSLEMDGHSMPADKTSSKFYHKLDSTLKVDPLQTAGSDALPSTERPPETREILAQALDIDAPYLAVIVVLSALASILVCGLIIGLVLHRRRTTGTYPKGSGSTLASPPKNKRGSKEDKAEVVPRGFPRVGISPADVAGTPQLSPTVPRSKRQNRNADAW